MDATPDTSSEDDRAELRSIATRLRTDAWELAERWSVVAAESASATSPRGGEQLTRFGEIPAFLAALAHHLERLADGDPELIGTAGSRHPGDDPAPFALPATDDGLRAAAIDHARSRASAGYDQREMLAEIRGFAARAVGALRRNRGGRAAHVRG